MGKVKCCMDDMKKELLCMLECKLECMLECYTDEKYLEGCPLKHLAAMVDLCEKIKCVSC